MEEEGVAYIFREGGKEIVKIKMHEREKRVKIICIFLIKKD